VKKEIVKHINNTVIVILLTLILNLNGTYNKLVIPIILWIIYRMYTKIIINAIGRTKDKATLMLLIAVFRVGYAWSIVPFVVLNVNSIICKISVPIMVVIYSIISQIQFTYDLKNHYKIKI
jgi:hypothetical protein